MKLWALLYHNTKEYDLPEVLAVSENTAHLQELAVKDAEECFGKEYVDERGWMSDGLEAGGGGDVSSSLDNDDSEAEYYIVEVSFGTVI